MSYSDLIKSPDPTFKTQLDQLCFAEYYNVLHQAIEASRFDIATYLVNEKLLEPSLNHLLTALNLSKGPQNDEIIRFLASKVRTLLTMGYESQLLKTATDLQIERIIDSKALIDTDGAWTLSLLKTRPQAAKLLSQTVTSRQQAKLKRLSKAFYEAGFNDVADRFQKMMKPTQKSTLTVDQLMTFLKKNQMDDYVEMLEEVIEAYNE